MSINHNFAQDESGRSCSSARGTLLEAAYSVPSNCLKWICHKKKPYHKCSITFGSFQGIQRVKIRRPVSKSLTDYVRTSDCYE